jgi:hypothetical protein
MKTALALITFLFCTSIFSLAQEQKKALPQVQRSVNEIDVSYYNSYVGHNIAVEYNRNFGKHTLVLGIKYHMNRAVGLSEYPTGSDAYHKHFYARKFPEHFGLSLGYEYHLKDINPYVSPYLLYNLQFSRMPTKHIWVQRDSGYSYRLNQVYNGPFIALENTIGAGFSVKLTDWLSLNQSGGVNLPFIYGQYASSYKRSSGLELDGISYQWRAGLTVSL